MHHRLIQWILALAGFAMVLAGTSVHGAGVTWDGAFYLSCAANLAGGKGFTGMDGLPFVHWPPLFPLLLAGFDSVGVDPAVGIRYVHAAIFGLTASGFYWLLRRDLRSRTLPLAGACGALLAIPLLHCALAVLSETLFILLLGLFLYSLQRFMESRRPGSLAAASVLAALACLQRYAGLALPLAGSLILLAGLKNIPFRKRAAYGGVLCAASGIPLALWIGRNYLASSALTQFHPGLGPSLALTLSKIFREVSAWLAPFPPWLLGILCLALLVAWFFPPATREAPRPKAAVSWSMAETMAAFLGVYMVFILAAISLSKNVGPNPARFLAVAYLPLLFVALAGLDRLTTRLAGRGKWEMGAKAVIACLCAVWIGFGVANTGRYLDWAANEGRGMFEVDPSWPGAEPFAGCSYATVGAMKQWPLVRWLESHPLDGPVYSNAPPVLYALFRTPSRWSPSRRMESLDGFARDISRRGGAVLVRFGFIPGVDLSSRLTLTPLAEFPEGGVYFMSRAK